MSPDYVSRNGNPSWAASHSPAALDAPAVDRLLAAGARLVGKTQWTRWPIASWAPHQSLWKRRSTRRRKTGIRAIVVRLGGPPSLLDSPISRLHRRRRLLPRAGGLLRRIWLRPSYGRRVIGTASSCSRRRTTSSAGSRATSKC